MKVYGLYASGNSINGWRFSMRSVDVFTSKEGAEKYIPIFKQKCMDAEQYFEAACDDNEFVIKIQEYNLHD